MTIDEHETIRRYWLATLPVSIATESFPGSRRGRHVVG